MTAAGLHGLYLDHALAYLLAVLYMVSFVPFWHFVSRTAPAAERVPADQRETGRGWFRVPEGFGFHPGHAWARRVGGRNVKVGIDDFARAVVGPIAGVTLPGIGARLRRGQTAWTLHGAAGSLPILAPVDGEVVAVNRGASLASGRVETDPYGEGWLLEVRRPRAASSLDGLLSGAKARAWMESVAERLHGTFAPELGPVAADGGMPVHGIGAGLAPANWDRLVSDFFLNPPEEGRS
jgi:glycine cleavage system H lipoate-binding protein